MNEAYSMLAKYYDVLTDDVDGAEWARFYTACFEKFCAKKPESVLELACGTGRITLELARAGFDMTALDISPDMLAQARAKLPDNVLLLCQDMRSFELYGTVDAAVCPLDSMNYLLSTDDIARCLALVHNYLAPGGCFVFDMNTQYKFENVFAGNVFTYEADMKDGGLFLTWQNCFHPKSRVCDFYLTAFEQQKNGLWERQDELQRERCYSLKTVKKLIADAGFELAAAVSDTAFSPLSDTCERCHFICVKK